VALTWNPPVSEEEEKKKFTWTPPKPVVTAKPIDLSKYTQEGYDEPTWVDVAKHSTKAGFGDLQSMMLNLGRLFYEGGVQITDKVTDIFDKDLYDPKKDKLRAWIGDLASKSETIAEDSWEKVISKNRLKNFVALGGRAVPLSLITLLSGGALVGAHPILAMKMGSLPAHMIPFGAASVGGHARRIEKEFEARGQEAPYLAQLIGGVLGAMGEVATEAIPFQRWLNVFGGSRTINRGAKTFLAKYGKMGIDWAVSAVTETLQEVGMVPIEKSLNNMLLDEKEPLLPIPELIQAGLAGLSMSIILGGLGSSSSAIRSFSESKVDKMLKHEITRREGVYDIAEKMVDESTLSPVDKELQKMEIEKARVCEKYGLDPKDFKYTKLPKGKIETTPIEEDASKIIKDLQDAGYGKEETAEELVEKQKTEKPSSAFERALARERERAGKIDGDKVKVHTMQKDEFVKRMMKSKDLDPGDQDVAESVGAAVNEEVPPQYTPVGATLSGKMQEYMKMLRASLILDPSAKNVYDALAEMEGTTAESEYVCRQVRDTWEKMVTKEEDEILIDKYMDMPEKYQDEITKKGLQNEADWAIRQYKRLGDVALKAGAIGGLWRNYAPYAFKNIHEWLNINKDANIPVTGVLGTKFAHGIERNLQNYDEAEKAGLIPEHKIGLKLSEYMYSLSKVIAHKNFIDTVREMRDEDGHPVATRLDSREEWASRYRQVGNPEFAQYVMVKKKGKMVRVAVRWKPEVASAIEEIAVPAWMQSKPMRNIRMVKGIVKRIIFLNPAIHGWNIFSDVLDEVNFNFFEAWNAIKPGGKGARIYLDNTRLTREALKDNLNLAHTGRLGRKMREEIYDLVPIEGKNVITKGMGKLFAWNDNVLWTTIVRNAQMYTYALKRKQGLTGKQAAAFTNDLLGTLPKRYFTNFEWGVASTFFLARNWTISNLRLLTGAIGPMSNIIPIKALTRKEMSPADMQALAPHYIRHLIKGMFGLIMLTNLLNKLFTGKWALENEPGHKLDVKLGNFKDNKGRDMYMVMPLLRYMRDYVGWGTQPRQTLLNKMEPVMKTSLELLINRCMWQDRRIMHPDAPIPEKIKDAAEYALWSWTPFDQFLDSENEVKTWIQKIAYFTGTWVRRGSSISSHSFNTLRSDEKVEFVQTLSPKLVNELYGNLAVGRIYGEVAKKLYDFRSKKGYVKEKLDASIDKLLTGGDIPGAIELMVESGRYKDMSAIKDRIMPYLMLRK